MNIVNDCIYYLNGKGNIYKVYSDSAMGETLYSGIAGYINVVGGWIYFTSISDGFSLYRMRIDGTDRVKLCGDACSSINIIDAYVYYEHIGHDEVCRIRADGTGRQVLE